MPKIFLKNRCKNIEYEPNNQETINDMKDIIRTMLNKRKAEIKIVYKGKIVSDNVPMCSFQDGDVFDYVIRSDEIEMTNMENKVQVKIRNEKRYVDPAQILIKNGKHYLIVRRERRKSFREEISGVISMLRVDVIIKIAMIIAFFISSNKELAYLFGGLMLMRIVNRMKFRLKMNGCRGVCFGLKVIVSFFISLFMLNSDEILDFKGGNK